MAASATRALLACGPLAAGLFVAADLTGAVLTPGYSITSQAISELVARGAAAKAVVDPLLLLYHALVIPFALGLHRAVAGRPRLGPGLLAGAGAAGVVLTAVLPCDPGCAPVVSLTGALHIAVAIPMGFAILGGLAALSRAFARDPAWAGLARYTGASAALGLALALATVALADSPVVGLLERALTLSYLQAYAVLGLAGITRRA